jgi:hypothetical protein
MAAILDREWSLKGVNPRTSVNFGLISALRSKSNELLAQNQDVGVEQYVYLWTVV